MKNLIIAIASLTVFGTSTTLSAKEAELTKTGVVREITCNGPTGLGMVKVETTTGIGLFGKTHHAEWIKVNSYELCGAKPGQYSFFSSLAYDAVFLGEVFSFDLKIKNGFIVSAKKKDKIDYMEFMDDVEEFKVYSSRSTHNWFFQGPTHVDYYAETHEIDEAVQKFTSSEFISSVGQEYWYGN